MTLQVRRKPLIAALLSIVMPGLGQVYNGQAKRGLIFYVLLGLIGLALIAILMFLPLAPLNVLLPLVLLVSAYIYVVIEAIITARRYGDTFEPKMYNRWYIYLLLFAGSVFVIRPVMEHTIRTCWVQTFRFPSGSMEDTLLAGDFLLANKFIYGPKIPFTDIRLSGIRKPRPGDVILFKYPKNPKKVFIKRVIAVEGQTVETRDKVVYVDGKKVPIPPKGKHTDRRILPRHMSRRDNFDPITVPEDKLFVMGDNRDNSHDSRYWGWVPSENIEGKAVLLYWSWDSASRRVRWGRIGQILR